MITELVIDRALWGKGALLNDDGTMCCLGHLSVACGVPKDLLINTKPGPKLKSLPDDKWINVPMWARFSSAFSCTFSHINDYDSDPEPKLIKLFAERGIALSFIGESK